MRQIIRDRRNEIVGYIQDQGNVKFIFDARNNIIGKVQDGRTFDRNNSFFGYGDQSGILLGESLGR